MFSIDVTFSIRHLNKAPVVGYLVKLNIRVIEVLCSLAMLCIFQR